MAREIRMLAPTGILGYGYQESSFARGMSLQPHFIGQDCGSTDNGPQALGSGNPPPRDRAVTRDTRIMLRGAIEAGIPLILGSAGTAGGRSHVAYQERIVREIAREDGLHFRLAVIQAEQDKAFVKRKLAEDKVRPLGPVPDLTADAVDRAEHIVGMMGTEPILRALDAGAQVIVAGRSSDTSLFAAIPAAQGFDHGLAWHAAKIVECGAAIAEPKRGNDAVMAYLRDDHFVIEAMDPIRVCTSMRVAAHALYENADPYFLKEPSGTLDTRACVYEQIDDRRVRVSGSRFIPADRYTIKLEGAERVGYRSIAIAGTRDPGLVGIIDEYLESVREIVRGRAAAIGMGEGDYHLRFIVYGKDGVMGDVEPLRDRVGHELGIVADVVARTQRDATEVLGIARTQLLHTSFPGRLCVAGNAAVPFDDMELGEVYQFNVWHIVEPDDPYQMFPIELHDL